MYEGRDRAGVGLRFVTVRVGPAFVLSGNSVEGHRFGSASKVDDRITLASLQLLRSFYHENPIMSKKAGAT